MADLDVDAVDLWARKYGVENAGPQEMAQSFETVERDLSVSRIPDDDVNANNDVLRRGVRALGWKGGVLAHNRVGCTKSGFCELGCAYDAKQNAAKVLVPQAKAAGGRVHASVDVRRITFALRDVLEPAVSETTVPELEAVPHAPPRRSRSLPSLQCARVRRFTSGGRRGGPVSPPRTSRCRSRSPSRRPRVTS